MPSDLKHTNLKNSHPENTNSSIQNSSPQIIKLKLPKDESPKYESLGIPILSKDSNTDKTFKEECYSMIKFAFPVMFATIARMLLVNTDTAFCGHLGTDELAGSALASIVFTILFSIIYQPSVALNSVCSQAIGSGNKPLAGIWLQLAIILSTISAILVLPLYFEVDHVLSLFDHKKRVLHFAKLFGQFSAIAVWPQIIYCAIRQYFQALEILMPATIISWLAVIFNIGFNWLFIYGIKLPIKGFPNWSGLGYKGSPLATSTCLWFQLTAFLLYAWFWKGYPRKSGAWKGWNLKAAVKKQRLIEFFKIILPIMIGDASNNWSYQIVAIMSGTLKSYDVASINVAISFYCILWAFYWGFGLCTIVKIGKYIGDGNIIGCKRVIKTSLFLVSSLTIGSSIIMIFLRKYIARIYTHDKKVLHGLEEAIPLICLNFILNGITWTFNSVLEGMSRNKVRSIANVICSWVVYFPLCIYLAYYSPLKNKYQPVCIIWAVASIADLLNGSIAIYMVYNTNWNQQVTNARRRSEAQSKSSHDDTDQNNNEKNSNKCTSKNSSGSDGSNESSDISHNYKQSLVGANQHPIDQTSQYIKMSLDEESDQMG